MTLVFYKKAVSWIRSLLTLNITTCYVFHNIFDLGYFFRTYMKTFFLKSSFYVFVHNLRIV